MSGGRANPVAGRGFEDEVEATLRCYSSDGFLRCKKVEPPMRIFGGRTIFLANPFLDFIGAWSERGGRLVCFECKATRECKLGVGGSGGLNERQLDAMRLWDAAGAVAFLLWRHPAKDGMVALPSEVELWPCRAMDDLPAKHICAGEGITVGQGTGFRTVDFLPVMRKLWTDS